MRALTVRITARCVLYYNTSWQGRRCALPLHPSSSWYKSGIEPSCTIKTYRRFITRKRRLRSPPAPPSTNPTRIGCAPSFPPMDHGQHFGYWTSSRGVAPCTTTKEIVLGCVLLGSAQTQHNPAIPPFVI